MKKVLVIGCGLLFLIGSYTTVHAETIAELKALIQLLTQQIAALEQQIAARVGAPGTGGGAVCPMLYRTLYSGISGDDVQSLQRFLAADASLYPEASITGYFGPATMRAVQRWQARNGVVSSGTPGTTGYGVVGQGTRATIARICSTSVPPSTTLRSCTVGSVVLQS